MTSQRVRGGDENKDPEKTHVQKENKRRAQSPGCLYRLRADRAPSWGQTLSPPAARVFWTLGAEESNLTLALKLISLKANQMFLSSRAWKIHPVLVPVPGFKLVDASTLPLSFPFQSLIFIFQNCTFIRLRIPYPDVQTSDAGVMPAHIAPSRVSPGFPGSRPPGLGPSPGLGRCRRSWVSVLPPWGLFLTSTAERPQAQPPRLALGVATPSEFPLPCRVQKGSQLSQRGRGGRGRGEGGEAKRGKKIQSMSVRRGTYHDTDTWRLPCPQEVNKTSASQQEISNHFSDTKATGIRCRSEEEGLWQTESQARVRICGAADQRAGWRCRPTLAS